MRLSHHTVRGTVRPTVPTAGQAWPRPVPVPGSGDGGSSVGARRGRKSASSSAEKSEKGTKGRVHPVLGA